MLINNRIYNIDTNSRHWAISLALIVILSVIMTFIPVSYTHLTLPTKLEV